MKNSTLAMRLTMAVIFLAVIAYFGFNMAAYFMDPYTTTAAYSFTGENAVSVSGYVVRNEEVLTGGGELVYSNRAEGERVGEGGTVALIYQSAQALDDANALRSLEEQLEQLRYAQTLASGTKASARLDDEIRDALLAFRQSLAGGKASSAGDTASALRTAVLKRSYAYSGTGDLEAAIAGLQEQISVLSAAADPSTSRVTAPKAGLFSSLVDGYESVLNLEMLEMLTPERYNEIQPAEGAAGVGKMVYGSKWAFVTLMDAGDVGRMAKGDTVTLRFQKGLDRDMSMRVESVSPQQNGQRVVVFSSEKYLGLTTLLRRQNAQVIFDTYSGIRVPRSAVRVENLPVTDEEGNPLLDSAGQQKTESFTCVYCLWGRYARRKPVQVLWQEEDYLLVVPDEDALAQTGSDNSREGRRLRAGDAVITAAAELYDGKVIQ